MKHYKIISEWGACLVRNLQKHKRIKWCWSTERVELFDTILAAANAAVEARVSQFTIEEIKDA